MCKFDQVPFPERMTAAAIREHVSITLAEWVDGKFKSGATVEEVHRQLAAAVAQIERVRNYCARERESEVEHV